MHAGLVIPVRQEVIYVIISHWFGRWCGALPWQWTRSYRFCWNMRFWHYYVFYRKNTHNCKDNDAS